MLIFMMKQEKWRKISRIVPFYFVHLDERGGKVAPKVSEKFCDKLFMKIYLNKLMI